MKISKCLSIIIIAIGFVLFGCESVEKAEKVADEFYLAYNTEDEVKMESLFDKTLVIDAGIISDFYNVINQHWQTFGKETSHKKYGFSSNTNNGETYVMLKYEVETATGTKVFEKLNFIKRGEEYKIYAFEYNVDKSIIDKQE
jgi:hypothetical protein